MNATRFRKRWAFIFAFAACLSAAPRFDPVRYLDHVKFLSSKNLRGRASGSPELEKAARYIAGQFKDFGLKPLHSTGYFQPFSVTTKAELGCDNYFAYTLDGRTATLKAEKDYLPLSLSSRASMTGEVVFAGYGITAPEYGYDDYAGLDVRGKIVLILRHEPQEYEDKSIFAGRAYTGHAQYFEKAANARNHGATGVIIISDRASHRSETDALEPFVTAAGPAEAGIAVAQVRAEAVEPWFAAAGKNVEEIQEAIDQDLKPRSFPFPAALEVRASLYVEHVTRTVQNVAGYLPGLTDEYVIIGAHYDHLGHGAQFSLAPMLAGTVHPGADDNASGTAGMLELARWFAGHPKQQRGILFLAFAGEELGLLGSSHYVKHPLLPPDQAVAMINLDMIGRMRDGKLYIGGSRTGTDLSAILEEASRNSNLNLDLSETIGYGSSDHASFTAQQIPALFFFTGLHGDYHTPGDMWHKIDAPETVRLLELVARVTDHLRQSGQRPVFIRPKREPGP